MNPSPLLTLILMLLPAAWAQGAAARTPAGDATVKALTLDEKVAELQAAAPAVPRLKIKAYNWWNEGLHGIARNGYATVFPQAIGLAATWDPDLLHAVGDTIATEARAKYNAVGLDNDHGRYQGLTIWSPNINIFRDPRWGRGQETYGEDPFLTGTMATAFVEGLQGPDPAHPKTIATVKHFAVHSGPEAGRHGFDVDPSPYDLEATYLPAFRQAITVGHAQSIMCAYNALHGVPACANTMLLDDHLRQAWGFKGYVVTDCDAVEDMTIFHYYRPSAAENAAAALKAGTDLNCGTYFGHLKEAVASGLVSEKDMDRSLDRLWAARRRLGLDGAGSPYDTISPEALHTSEAAGLALKAARESIVLLKNNGALPLKAGARIAVIGPNADTIDVLQANYHGTILAPVTPLTALRSAFGVDHVAYAQGAPVVEQMPLPVPETALRTVDGAPGLTGDYYDNSDFAGTPVMTRVDRSVDLDLYNAVPAPALAKGSYGIRWHGRIVPPAPGDYTFSLYTERCWECGDRHDQVALFIDGKPVVQDTGDGKHLTAQVHFDDVRSHDLTMEFRHTGGDWGVRLQWQPPVAALRAQAVTAAKDADAVIAFVGLSPDIEGEELSVLVPGFDHGDRTDLTLPASQAAMLEAVKATGKPLIVVDLSGGAVALDWAQSHADAVLQAWYPGEGGGQAIAETLTGANNPSGRLPVTFYQSVQDLPPFVDYRMAGRTYRYFAGRPLYPFGYGLSYTTFSYRDLQLSQTVLKAGRSLHVTATVTNSGAVEGDEVAQVYLTPPMGSQGLLRTLVGFRRVHLKPGASATLGFDLDPRSLSTVDAQGRRAVRSGSYDLFVGGGQPGTLAGLHDKLTVSGNFPLPE